MREQATRIGRATLTRYAEVVHAGLTEMRGATAPRLLLEVICARLLLPSASDAESALLQRVERIETRLDMSIPDAEKPERSAPVRRSEPAPPPPAAAAEPAPTPSPAPVPKPSPEPSPPEPEPVVADEVPVVAGSAEPNAAAVRTLWPTVRDKVRQRSRTTEVMLAGATVRAVEGNTLVLSHESAPLAKRLSEQRNADVIAEALKDALGVDWRVRCAGWFRRRPRRPKCRPSRIPTNGPKKRACSPKPVRTTRRHRAAIPKRQLSSCCKTSWARAASTTASQAEWLGRRAKPTPLATNRRPVNVQLVGQIAAVYA
jgi:DNA polymerase-3 subunit gamma/tau